MKILILVAIAFVFYKFVLPTFNEAKDIINDNNRTLLDASVIDSDYNGSDRQKALNVVKEKE